MGPIQKSGGSRDRFFNRQQIFCSHNPIARLRCFPALKDTSPGSCGDFVGCRIFVMEFKAGSFLYPHGCLSYWNSAILVTLHFGTPLLNACVQVMLHLGT